MPLGTADPRKERAAATRLRMIRAAYNLFSTRGLSTPMTAIAEEAGVAVQTLYFTFHTKSKLVMEAHDFAVLGENSVEPQNQPAMQQMRTNREQTAVIDAVIAVSCDIIPRVGPLLWHLQASVEDPEITSFLADRERLRVAGYEVLVDELLSRGPLRPGLERRQAVDIMLALTNAQLALFFTRERGWTLTEWAAWTRDCLCSALLPDPPRGEM